MDGIRTHGAIRPDWVGEALASGAGTARVRLSTRSEMAADERGLVHGGFVFGLADYAAMLAVNEPTVVLASAECRFLAPVLVGDELVAEAERISLEGKKQMVRVGVRRGEAAVFEGTFLCVVPAVHVLDRPPRGGP